MPKVSGKSKQAFCALSWQHVFLTSITLNVCLIAYEIRSLSCPYPSVSDQKLENFCFDEKMSTSGLSSYEMHVSKTHPPLTTHTEEGVADGGSKVINLDHGDPTMYEQYWKNVGDKTTLVISGWQSISYFSDISNLCWFLEPKFAKEIMRLHQLVGNAKTEDRHIVVGTGSTQLFQAALYALSSPDALEPISVVSASPYYSSYLSVTEFLKSGLYKWAGDAYTFDRDGPYIELVTSPNNPDGFMRQAVVNRSGGLLIHDLAYYWPQYTPITSPVDHDLMLFTVSKSTGHAGIRIGWALVKDKEVAKKMTKFIELNTIGVSKDSQLRAAMILGTVSDSCQHLENSEDEDTFFDFGRRVMVERWERLRKAVNHTQKFSLPDFLPELCNFVGKVDEPHPAFAWLKCEGDVEDCEAFLRVQKIISRSGKHFGVDKKYVRVSMLDRDELFDLFINRLLNLRS